MSGVTDDDVKKAQEIRSKLTSALLVVNAIIEKANATGFNVSYTSNLNRSTGKFDTNVEISKKL